jgi:alpha-glucosidase
MTISPNLASVVCAAALVIPAANAAAGQPRTLASPNGQLKVTLALQERLEPLPPGERLYYSVSFRGRDVVLDSPLGLDFRDMPPLAQGLAVREESRKEIDESWERVVGKSRAVRNRANELRLRLEETGLPHRRFDVVFRAYDDGVAFRYVLPEQPSFTEFRLASERSIFRFAADHTVWAAAYGSYTGHQEHEFDRTTLSSIGPSAVVGLPLLVKVDSEIWAAIAEADLRDWAGMYVAGAGPIPHALVTTLSPQPGEPGTLVRGTAPHSSPWRVLMIGDRPGALVESDLIQNLAAPCALPDTSWIAPGRAAWDRWWSGDYAPDATFPVGMNTETVKYFTQFAADMGWEYVLVDWGWYGAIKDAEGGTDALDLTKPAPQVDVPEIVRFAKARGVKVLLWLLWDHVDRQMDEAFALYQRWGISGVKIDFMARDDQWMVNWYEKAIRKAAEHRLLVDFHGAYKPTGLNRTYPNYITQEGVLGNEYNKWSARVTPGHNVTLPFTRMLAGPMDFTPGGFRNATRATFKAQDSAPYVMGTRAHQLAMMVVYESPLQVLCDSPYNYRGQAGLDFLKAVPASWDETRVLAGEVGEYVVVARRSGAKWFLGAMTNWEPRSLAIPTAFLGQGDFSATAWEDAPEAAEFPDRLRSSSRTVRADGRLTLKLAPGGGCAMVLAPAGPPAKTASSR